jgi:hypothetical protein
MLINAPMVIVRAESAVKLADLKCYALASLVLVILHAFLAFVNLDIVVLRPPRVSSA